MAPLTEGRGCELQWEAICSVLGFLLMFFPKEQGLLSLFFEAEILDWFSTVPMFLKHLPICALLMDKASCFSAIAGAKLLEFGSWLRHLPGRWSLGKLTHL